MYEYFIGQLVEKNPAYAVIDKDGIGFVLLISVNTYSRLPATGDCKLYTHLAVREDAHVLYGFYSKEERKLFRLLITVSGIGTNTALLILSSMTAEEVIEVIANGDVERMRSIKGIGTKTAQRIMVDLRDKIDKEAVSAEKLDIGHNTIKDEALTGLIVLGFNKKTAGKAIDSILQKHTSEGQEITIEKLIKDALKLL